ncbi:SAVMC3_10250 family protein [Streptomyces sp. PSAA01]|uniref:DUF7019 family protein n=1 Tax=Streptomyces sp. PSAA01 TaxID=2912762 RepID=UPI001F1D33C8|nr:SAVMC3_10250 family protein [Streptomyces sp. PSAA01]MCG0289362.1 hypothetical protein [Streptomyces sp. PSAA01]
MRYYLYVSRAKVDMLFGQIPRKLLPRLVTEARADLKVLSVSVQQPREEPTLYDRLNVVETYLDREYDIGWMTEPAQWFCGESGLRMAVTGRPGSPVLMTYVDEDIVVALIGSSHHLVGREEPPAELGRVGHSWLPALHELLEQSQAGRGTVRDVLDFAQHATGPATWCEFLARQLLRGRATGPDGRERDVVIATPLYVAMSDEVQGA